MNAGSGASGTGLLVGGRYRMDAEIGAGGMGAVFRAVDTKTGGVVALKLLLGADEKSLARFRREARVAASLRHPHIVALLDVDVDDPNGAYLVMELIDGVSLQVLLEREGKLETTRAALIGSQLFSALAHAHAAGIIHRDVKPSNVLVSRSDMIPDLVRLADFGLARHADPVRDGPAVTTMAAMLGTPAYMPPEQMAGQLLDPRADVYSGGLILYRMLAGVDAYALSGTDRILAVIAGQPGRPLSTVAPWVDSALAALVDACIAPASSHRPSTAAEVVDRLSRWTAPTNPRMVSPTGKLATNTPSVGPLSGAHESPIVAVPQSVYGGPTLGPETARHAPTVSGPTPLAATGAATPTSPLIHPRAPLLFAPTAARPGLSPIVARSAGGSRTGLIVAVTLLAVAVAGLTVLVLVLFVHRQPPPASEMASARADAASSAPGIAAASSTSSASSARSASSVRSTPAQSPSSPRSPATAEPPRAPASTTCICKALRGGQGLCSSVQEPVCGCDSENICKVPVTPDGRCLPTATSFGGPGKKSGDPCSGFFVGMLAPGKPSNAPRSGVLSCNVCTVPARLQGVRGAPCSGMNNIGIENDGVLADCR